MKASGGEAFGFRWKVQNGLVLVEQEPKWVETFTVASDATGLLLTVGEDALTLASPSLESEANRFHLLPAQGCDAYPEAELNASKESLFSIVAKVSELFDD